MISRGRARAAACGGRRRGLTRGAELAADAGGQVLVRAAPRPAAGRPALPGSRVCGGGRRQLEKDKGRFPNRPPFASAPMQRTLLSAALRRSSVTPRARPRGRPGTRCRLRGAGRGVGAAPRGVAHSATFAT